MAAGCTLVISHQQNMVGKTDASIDAVSKPTKKLVPSGCYDPAAARQRIEEWKAKQVAAPTVNVPASKPTEGPTQRRPPLFLPVAGSDRRPGHGVQAALPSVIDSGREPLLALAGADVQARATISCMRAM
jgi:hypothetical protein